MPQSFDLFLSFYTNTQHIPSHKGGLVSYTEIKQSICDPKTPALGSSVVDKDLLYGLPCMLIQYHFKNFFLKISATFSNYCKHKHFFLFFPFINDLNEYHQQNGNTGIENEYNDDPIIQMLSIFVLLFADDTVLLFADDTVLFATTPKQLQQCLVDCNTYCKTWQLAVNKNKTKVKVFGSNKRNLRNVYFTLNGKDVEIVDKYKYRGIFFTSNCRFIKAQTYLITQASTAMYLLYRRIYNLNLPIDLQLKLFDNTLVPILTL